MKKDLYKKEFQTRDEAVKYCIKKGIQEKEIRDYRLDDVIPFSSRINSLAATIMSNMYPCTLTYKGKTFNSVEQAFHYYCFTQFPQMQEQIMACKNAFEVKKIIKGAEKDGDYEQKKYRVLANCLQLKYQQCSRFRDFIKASGNTPLVEWAEWGDVEFGCCKYEVDGEWRLIGQNACGRLMMKVRLANRKEN